MVPPEQPPSRAGGATPLTGILCATTASVIIWLLSLRPGRDVDLWLHLRIGEFLRHGGRFGHGADPFVAIADKPYLPSQWLADLAGSWTYAAGGIVAIEWLRLVCVVFLAALVMTACRLRGGATAAAAATLAGIFATSLGWGERPQVLGLAFLAATSAAWWRTWETGRPPWLLIPLTWVWACVHGSWVTGIGLGAVMVVAIGLDQPHLRGRLPRLLAVPLLSVAAAALTPLGPRLLRNPFQVSAALTGRVNEWQRPAPGNLLMWLVIVAAVVAAVRLQRSRRLGLGRLALCLGAIVLAVWMVRMIAVGAIIVAPVLAEALSRVSTPPPVARAERLTWSLAIAAVLVGGGILAAQPRPAPVGTTVSQVLATTKPHHVHVIAAPELTGWLLWTYPDLVPLRDLRSEIYSPAVSAAYDAAYAARPGWPAYLTDHHVQVVVVPKSSPLSRALANDTSWSQRAHDANYVVWERVQPPGS